MQLSRNLWLSEIEFSDTAIKHNIDNSIPFTNENIRSLFTLAVKFETVRECLGGQSLKITSGFRSDKLNKKLSKSAKRSRHLILKALDLRLVEGLSMASMGQILYTLRDRGVLRYVYANSSRSWHIDWQ